MRKIWFGVRPFQFMNVKLSNCYAFIFSGPLGLMSDILQNLNDRCIDVNDHWAAAEDSKTFE